MLNMDSNWENFNFGYNHASIWKTSYRPKKKIEESN